ncbi:MAG: endonuclease/exonuclease/phosphatase family protein [Acidimicrobiia bacterium]
MSFRIGSFNVENLFDRPRVMNLPTWEEGRPILDAYAKLTDLLEKPLYTPPIKADILRLLGELGLLQSDVSTYVQLRKIRGALLRRPRTGPVEVVADGRASWVGWLELTTQHVDALATEHTAMVMRDIGADVLGVIEAESRPTLNQFSSAMLQQVHAAPYEQVMLVDGNDTRGIDVGLLAKGTHRLTQIRTHVFDNDPAGVVFSRDCCEYHLRTERGNRLVVLVNHFKSKGYGAKADSDERRRRQAVRVADIYRGLVKDGARYIAVVGDLNDDPTSAPLAPLIQQTDLADISTHPNFDFGERRGTFGSGGELDKIDYVLLSPSLYRKATGGAVFRKGVWHGPRTKNPWQIYETMKEPVHAASDHAAIYADVNL